MKSMVFALIAAALFGLAFAEPTFKEVCRPIDFLAPATEQPGAGMGLMFIMGTFLITSFAIALAYMLSKIREDAHLSTWAKDEASNLVISVLLFIGLMIFFMGSCEIASAYSGGDQFRAADQYLSGLMTANGQRVVEQLVRESVNNQLDATAAIYMGAFPFWGAGVGKTANLRAYSAQKEMLTDLYIPILASINAQRYILQTIQWIGASILLPFAFVLRLVPFTREIGNMLIALFFGTYIVVPTFYAMSGEVFKNKINVSPMVVDPDIEMFNTYALDHSDTVAKTDTVFYKIGSTLPQAIFLPNLTIIVAVTCTMSLAKALRAIAV
jgi:hypothetical protein